MARKVFLSVGELTHQDLLEVLRPEHAFDLVVHVTQDLDVLYFGISDGLDIECKEGEHVNSLMDWFETHITETDLVFTTSPNMLPDKVINVDTQWLRDMRMTLPARVPGFTLIYAVYGTTERSVDVTETIAKAIGSESRLQVSNSLLGCDPHFGAGKMLSVHYDIEGVRRIFNVWEGNYFLVV